MPGSKTTPGLASARNDAPASVAFRGVNSVGTRVYNAFAAQWLAYTLPYRRFAVILAEDCARIGGDVGCYSLIAVDSHHILLAGLPAHSLSSWPSCSGHRRTAAKAVRDPWMPGTRACPRAGHDEWEGLLLKWGRHFDRLAVAGFASSG